MGQTHSENETFTQLAKKFFAFYGTRKVVTVFKRVCQRSLSWSRWILSTSYHPISLWLAVIFF